MIRVSPYCVVWQPTRAEARAYERDRKACRRLAELFLHLSDMVQA